MFDLSMSKEEEEKQRRGQSYSPPSSRKSLPDDLGPRISKLPALRATTEPQQSNNALITGFKMLPSHVPTAAPVQAPKASTWDQIKAFDLKGLGSEVLKGLDAGYLKSPMAQQDADMAKLLTKSIVPGMANAGRQQLAEQQQFRDRMSANPANSFPAMLGEQIPQLPLWIAGEGALAKLGTSIGKLAPPLASVAGKVGSKLPGFVKGGLMDAATYGSIVAPTENIQQGGSFQDLLDKEKQLPGVLLGGTLARGVFKGIGEGARLGNDVIGEGGSLKQALALRKLNTPEIASNPLQDAQSAFKAPTLQNAQLANPITRSTQRGADLGPLKLRGTITPEYKARQAELENTLRDYNPPLKSLVTTKPAQQSIDESMGIGKPTEDYGGLDAFGKPLQSFKKNTDTQDAVTEISAKMTKQVNDIANMLKQQDGQTKIETIRKTVKGMGGIKQGNADIFEEQKVIPNWIRNDKTGRPLDEVANTLGMTSDELLGAISDSAYKPKDYVTEAYRMAHNDPEYQALSNTLDTLKSQIPQSKTLNVIPKLKPRELTPKIEPLPIQQPQRMGLSGNLPIDELARPVKQLTSIKREPLQWDNRSGIPLKSPAPIKPIPTEQTLADVLKGREVQPITINETVNTPLKSPNLVPRDVPTSTEIPNVGNSEIPGISGVRIKEVPNSETKITKAPEIDQMSLKDIPDAPSHPVAEHIISKLDDFEAAARARIAANKGRLNAGLPIDTMIDYSIIGGIKIARGTVKYSVWAADMVADLGNSVKPHLKDIWEESNKQHSLMVDGTFAHALPEPQSKIIIGKPKDSINFKDALKKFYVKVVNTQQPIYDAGKVSGSDVGKLASNTKNVSGIVDHNFLKAMVDTKGNKVGESLKSTVDAIPKGQEEEFWTYMSQRHNIDRARIESHEVPKVDRQGFIVKDKDGNTLYDTVVDKKATPVQANYTPGMSAEAVKFAERAHPEYKAAGDGIVKWLDDFMQTWGVDTGIVDKDIYAGLRKTYRSYFPTQRDFSTLESAIPDGVASKFADQRTPIRKATGSERDIVDPIENIMNLVSKVVRTAKYNEVGQSLLDAVKSDPAKMKQFAEVIPVKDGMFANTDNIISVLIDGKAQYLKINNKMLLDSMNGLPKSIGHIPVLDTLTNGFKGLITQKNPFFAIRNIFRDLPTAYAFGSEANPLKFSAGLIGAGKDILTNSERLQKYQAIGGGGANFFSPGDVTKSAAELMGKGSTIKKVLKLPIKAIEKFNNITETAPRLAEFNRVLSKTGDTTKALFAANDVTVNFSRGGNYTKTADKVAPYLNAGVQGLDKFVRQFLSPKTALATIVKSGVAITAPDIALYMVNRDNPNYQELDNRTKDNYFLIPKSDGTFFKIPKSRELGVLFGSLLERGLRAAEGQKDSFKGFGNTVATNFAPANPIDSNFFAPATWNLLAKNKDFADRPIVPQGMLMDKRSPYLQYDDKTTSIAKAIGELTTNIPGLPGGLSPKQLDYLVKSYSGVIGQFGIPALVPGGSPLKALTSQFTADPKLTSQDTTDFYDKLDKLSSVASDKNIINKIPSKKLTPEEDMRNSMTGVSTALSRGTKLISSIQSGSDPNKDARIKEIKTQMLDLTSKAISADSPKSMQSVENTSKKMFTK